MMHGRGSSVERQRRLTGRNSRCYGALLVLALLVTPATAAARVTASPVLLPVLSVVFAVASIEGGILLALGSSIPISPYVTTISFTIYFVCRLAGTYRTRRWGARKKAPQPV